MMRRRNLVLSVIFLAFSLSFCAGLLIRTDITSRALSAVDDFAKQLGKFSFGEIQKCNDFFNKFNKKYVNVSEKRKATLNFLYNQRANILHNKEYLEGRQTFMRHTNEHSDLSTEEFNRIFNGFRRAVQPKAAKSSDKSVKPPKSLDYSSKGYVTPVQKQGTCGSCWSFSAIGAIEGQIFKETGKLIKFSEQNLIDCNRDDEIGNFGCEGGDMTTAYSFLMDQEDIATEAKYPYEERDNLKCRYNKSLSSGYAVISFELIESGDEKLLLSKLAEHGPIAIAVDASLSSFQNYKSGIYLDSQCSTNINHAVLLVGFGTDKVTKLDYWLVKNSYGTDWGEKGYIRMARNGKNHCGIAEYPVVPKCKAMKSHK